MNLRDLAYAVAVADHRHFGRAARHCHTSQPTLSAQIKKLEDLLGVTLFERTNKSVTVTPAGERIISQARKVLEEAEQVLELARSQRGLSEPIRLGVIPTLSPYLLPWILPALHRAHPALKLVVREDLTTNLVEQLRSRQHDAVLIALPAEEPGFECLPLFDEPFWLVCPAGHRLARKRGIVEADLAGENILLLTEGHCLRDQALAVCGGDRAGREADDFRATSIETLRHLVAAGLGITLLPALALRDVARPGSGLKAFPFRNLEARRRLGLVWRKGFPRSAALQTLGCFVRGCVPKSVTPVTDGIKPGC